LPSLKKFRPGENKFVLFLIIFNKESRPFYPCYISLKLCEDEPVQKKQTFSEVSPVWWYFRWRRDERGRVQDESQTLVGFITLLIKGRHSEKCFSLVAAIHFLVLICALWQGFVRGNNEQLYHPLPPNCCSPCQKALRMMQVCICLIREKKIQNGSGETVWG
jgi:hypothetical protein